MTNQINKSDNEYAIINAFDLMEGMAVPCELYYFHNGQYYLALRNSSLTRLSILQLQKLIVAYKNIYVKMSDYDLFLDLVRAYKENESRQAFYRAYDVIRDEADIIINSAFETKQIDISKCENVSFNIKNTVVTFNASQIIQAINNVDDQDKYLYNHSVHVAFLNGLMGKWLGLDDAEITKLVKIGFLHDLGKTKIPEQILNKPAVLTPEEFEVIKTHPIYSFNMLVESGEKEIEILLAVRGHHEKTNGTGYPDGLTYDKITLYARITTISDIYDAMVSKRVYKNNHSPFEVLDEFSRGRFSNLDTHLINLFLQNMPNELLDRKGILSDGRLCTIKYINTNNYAYPMVSIGDDVIKTTPELRCIAVCE